MCRLVSFDRTFGASEKQRNAPKRAKTHNGVYDAAYYGGLTAENPCDNIEIENTDTAPVDTAYYQERKSNSIKHFVYRPFTK